MVVRTIDEIRGTEREVHGEGFTSLRLLLARDGMGFSVHKTVIPKGGPYHWHYTHHLEACYCVEGSGILTNLETGKTYAIIPDTIYVLDKHDDHTFRALSDIVLISIFNPPVTGQEVHNADGSYSLPLIEETV